MDRAPLANEIRGRSLRVVVGRYGFKSRRQVPFAALPGVPDTGKVRQQEGQKQYAAIRRILSLHRPAFAAGRAANDRAPAELETLFRQQAEKNGIRWCVTSR